MFDISKLYNLIKLRSTYDIIMGGTSLTPDYNKGTIILSVINQRQITRQTEDYKNVINDLTSEGKYKIPVYNIIETMYQLDFYKINELNSQKLEVEQEAINIQTFLNSMQAQEYLDEYRAAMLPNYSNGLTFSSEIINEQLVNRVFFEFKIMSDYVYYQDVKGVDNFNIKDYNY